MEEQLIKDYLNYSTTHELAKKYHIGIERVIKILKENNISIRTKMESIIMRRNLESGKTYKEILNIVIDNYVNKQFGLKRSGQEFGISENTVRKILQENNVPIRSLKEAHIISNKNDPRNAIYKKDKNFFSKESKNMAWMLGFLASDGNVRKENNCIRIELSIIDIEILERIKKAIKIENPISYRTDKKGNNFCHLNWNSRQHKQDLAKYSIVPNKTYILKPPYLLSEKYQLDYIRGYFDGDGTININLCHSGKSKAIRFGICSATPEVLKWIVDVFEKNGIPRVNLHQDYSHDKPFYSIIYSSVSSRKIYNLLYDNLQEDTLFLKRKKDRYEEILREVPERIKTHETSRPENG